MKWRTYGDYIPDDGLCLVKTDEGSLDIRRYTNCHHDWVGAYSDRVVKFIELRDLDEVLSGNADNDMRCNFAHTLCEIATPGFGEVAGKLRFASVRFIRRGMGDDSYKDTRIIQRV